MKDQGLFCLFISSDVRHNRFYGSITPRRCLVCGPRRIDDSHCNRIHSSLTAIDCLDNGYVGKQQVTLTDYCAEYWLNELQGSMDRWTDRREISEILLETALNTIQFGLQPSVTAIYCLENRNVGKQLETWKELVKTQGKHG